MVWRLPAPSPVTLGGSPAGRTAGAYQDAGVYATDRAADAAGHPADALRRREATAEAARAVADRRRIGGRRRQHLVRADESVQDAPAPGELVEVADHAGREVGHVRAQQEPGQLRLLER